MFRQTATRSAALALILFAGHAKAQVINIPPDAFPDETYFSANPGATVNICCFDGILPDANDGVFTFNGATVNLNEDGDSGWFTIDSFIEDVTYNVNDGGTLVRTKVVAGTGSTSINIFPGGTARTGLWLQGNAVGTITGGDIGLVAQGQAAIIVEDDASCSMSGGNIDTFILLQDNATFDQSGGTIDGGIQINDDVVATVSGGSSGNNGFIKDIGGILNVTGGTIGNDFVAEKGVVNLSGGGMGSNAAISNNSGVDPIFNMTGGALGESFRAFAGTFNLSGGIVGVGFRLGTPSGDGSGVTMNITCKSATLDSVNLDLAATPTTITTRGGAILSCVLLDNSVVSFDLNDGFVFGEDRFRAGATLTIKEPCYADTNGDGVVSPADFTAWINAFNNSLPGCDQNGDGSCTPSDFTAWIANYNTGC
jgi:hypothetical protein